MATLLTALRTFGLVRKVPTDIVAKLREMLGPGMQRRTGSVDLEACGQTRQVLSWAEDNLLYHA